MRTPNIAEPARREANGGAGARNPMLSRRALLRGATLVASVAASAAALAPRVLAGSRPLAALPENPATPICRAAASTAFVPSGAPRELKLTWNVGSVCTVGVPVADQRGFFAKHNLKVELLNFGGSTDQLLEAIATGKADAGVGMALRWLKPLEQGFDVRLTTGIHGGCMRLFTSQTSGIDAVAKLKGKAVGVSDLASPDKNFFSILAAQQGLDPLKDIDWRVYPADLLPVALQKNEVQAFSQSDPLGWVVRERDNLVEVASNLSGDYAHLTCCVLGVRGGLIRDDRVTAAALTQALLEAQDWVVANPDEAAAIFAPFAPKANPTQLAAMLRSHTHQHHPNSQSLVREIARYTQDLKDVGVIKPGTDPERFANRITADVLTS
jgi:NitT/TauT family transport system substrate-binding protein